MSDPHGLCRLSEGDVAEWRGLPEAVHLRFADLPACLGRLGGKQRRWLAVGVYDIERHETGPESWVDAYAWWGDGRVTFLDVRPAPAPSAPGIRGLLPPPEATCAYRDVEREIW